MTHYAKKAAMLLSRSVAAGSVLAVLSAGTAAASGFDDGYAKHKPQLTMVTSMDNGRTCNNPCDIRYRCPIVKPRNNCFDRCLQPYSSYVPMAHQEADIDTHADTNVHSVINTASINTTDIDQMGRSHMGYGMHGGGGYGFGFQNADINADAHTDVHSEINALSSNETNIDQSGGGYQNADVNNDANTTVDSTINAGSANVVNVNQN